MDILDVPGEFARMLKENVWKMTSGGELEEVERKNVKCVQISLKLLESFDFEDL